MNVARGASGQSVSAQVDAASPAQKQPPNRERWAVEACREQSDESDDYAIPAPGRSAPPSPTMNRKDADQRLKLFPHTPGLKHRNVKIQPRPRLSSTNSRLGSERSLRSQLISLGRKYRWEDLPSKPRKPRHLADTGIRGR